MEGIKPEERERLSESIDDLVRDTPRTSRAALTLKLLSNKLKPELWTAMRGILVASATEAAKHQLGI